MNTKLPDISRFRVGMLTVVRKTKRLNSNRCVLLECLCDCGKTHFECRTELQRGRTKVKNCRCRPGGFVHGMANKCSEYSPWKAMNKRCNNPNHRQWKNYGGRGISVCSRWRKSFENFLKDMGPRPSLKYGIDRFPNNNGNYEPGNCRWATAKEQALNSSNVNLLSFRGKTLPLGEMAIKYGLSSSVLSSRLNALKWPLEKALTTIPVLGQKTKRRLN